MFVKFTKLDGSFIWLNASYIVTVEPRKGGGSVVVPIGDGLDYDVREAPEKVLAMIEGAPSPAVIPVPVSDCLAPTPEDVSPEPETPKANVDTGSQEEVSPRQDVMVDAAKATVETEKPAMKPVKRGSRSRTKTGDEGVVAKKTVRSRSKAKKPVVLDAEQMERLRKLAPGSVRKLINTIKTQFPTVDAEASVKALEVGGVIVLDNEHVVWKSPDLQ